MFRVVIFFIVLIRTPFIYSQVDSTRIADSLKSLELQEIVIISQRTLSDKMSKPLAGLDHYLEDAGAINMIQRGSYASEPYINGMASERSVITIDGMRIYAACTDKMDPVTSYVEITNLAKADLHNGQSGSTGGATIAGSLDLVRKKGGFGQKSFKGMMFTGLETNNLQKIVGGSFSYLSPKFYTDVDFTYRDAENYKAGKRKEILYSQFTKFNGAVNFGYKVSSHRQIEASLIYDHALNVGYPALTMDVSFAKAFIGSIEYSHHHISSKIHLWKTKLYYNDVANAMDDSKRPDVPIRMDMPGWSRTAGFYSTLEGNSGKHTWKANLSGHHNRSLAEMTMFSNNPEEKDMFMLTWPGIYTNYLDLYAEDIYSLSSRWKMALNIGVAVHHNQVYDSFGLESLRIFYPDISSNNIRFLPRASANFHYEKSGWNYIVGMAYGERAPSVSEGYGYYLFNSFDRFDYIGNPLMKNERSGSLNTSISYKTSKLTVKLAGTYFYLLNYIIGRPSDQLSVMTIGASGVKVYEQLEYAHLFNGNLTLDYRFSKNWMWTNKLIYRRGIGAGAINLPLIQPFSYLSGITFSIHSFSVIANVSVAVAQTKFNTEFGESPLPAYAILNLSASQRFKIKKHTVVLKAGVENLFDTSYTTFADWNRIPRMGRNFFINLIWSF